jgi:hypothetical protein
MAHSFLKPRKPEKKQASHLRGYQCAQHFLLLFPVRLCQNKTGFP